MNRKRIYYEYTQYIYQHKSIINKFEASIQHIINISMNSCMGRSGACGGRNEDQLAGLREAKGPAPKPRKGKKGPISTMGNDSSGKSDNVEGPGQKDEDESFSLVDLGDVLGGRNDKNKDGEDELRTYVGFSDEESPEPKKSSAQQSVGLVRAASAERKPPALQKIVSVMEVRPANSILSNQKTEESSAYPTNDDQQTHSHQSSQKNLPIFPETTLNAKPSGQENREPPRPDPFDLAYFGQKKKRSSTDPKKLHADKDDDRLSDDDQIPDVRHQTQTIADSNVDHTQESASIRLQFLEQDPRGDVLKEGKRWKDHSTQAGANAQHRKGAATSSASSQGNKAGLAVGAPKTGSVQGSSMKKSSSNLRETASFPKHIQKQLGSMQQSDRPDQGGTDDEDDVEVNRVEGSMVDGESAAASLKFKADISQKANAAEGEPVEVGPAEHGHHRSSLQPEAGDAVFAAADQTNGRQHQSFINEKQNKSKWNVIPSFLSSSSHGKDKQVMNQLKQRKKKKEMAGQASSSHLRADGDPVVEEYPMESFNSAMAGAVQPSNNPSVLCGADELEDEEDQDPGQEKANAMVQKAASEKGNSSDSFVSIDSQDLSQQITRFSIYSKGKSKSHNGCQRDLDHGKSKTMFMEKNNNDLNLEQVEEPHFGTQQTNLANLPELDEGQQDDALVFDKSISISKNFEVLENAGPRTDMSMVIKFENVDNLVQERADGQGSNRSHFTKSTSPMRQRDASEKSQADPLDLSLSFTARSRELISKHSNVSKKSAWRRFIDRKAPVLNINAYKIQFGMQGEKVRYDHHDSYPICLLGVKFKPENKPFGGQNYAKNIKKYYKKMIKTNFFESLIWCSYRNKLDQDILGDPLSQRYLQQVLPEDSLAQQASYSTDMNWGCTIRVGQMLISNALMRHLLVDREFRYAKAEAFEQFGLHTKFSLSYLQEHPDKWEIYLNVLAQVMDNKLPEDEVNAQPVHPMQAFRIQNVSKMALATQSTMPGTWFGVGAVSHLFCKLNRLFRPLCDNFQICVLSDGFVIFEKIANKMRKEVTIPYTAKTYDHLDDEDEQVRKSEEKEAVEAIFFDEIAEQRKWKRHFRILQHPSTHLKQQEGNNFTERIVTNQENLVGNYRNGCLVIIPCMLGFQKIEKEYFEPIRYIFHEPNIVMGAMGGRPGQALYFVGLQNNELMFLDPHLVQDAVSYQEEDWVDCGFSKHEFAEFQAHSLKSSKNKSLRRRLTKGMPLLKPKKAAAAREKEAGPRFPKVKIRDSDRQTYHCTQTRKIHLSRCDPTMAFAFYLRNEGDFRQFYWLMKRGKDKFGTHWPFSLMDLYIMDEYFRQYKNKQATLTQSWRPLNAQLAASQKALDASKTDSDPMSLVRQRKQRKRLESMTEDYVPPSLKGSMRQHTDTIGTIHHAQQAAFRPHSETLQTFQKGATSVDQQSNQSSVLMREESMKSSVKSNFQKDNGNLMSFGPATPNAQINSFQKSSPLDAAASSRPQMLLENSMDLQISHAYMDDFEFGDDDDVEVIRKGQGTTADQIDDCEDNINRDMEFDMESFGHKPNESIDNGEVDQYDSHQQYTAFQSFGNNVGLKNSIFQQSQQSSLYQTCKDGTATDLSQSEQRPQPQVPIAQQLNPFKNKGLGNYLRDLDM